MPEHRPGTPADLRDLESFLWWDFSGPSDWGRWSAARGQLDGAVAWDDARRLHGLLRTLEGANSGADAPPGVTAAFDAVIAAHGVRPRLQHHDGPRIAPERSDDVVGRLAALAVQAMLRGDWRRFKLCRESTCRSSYFDSSKNGAKTWCSMAGCGARNKMRRYRARRAL